MAVVANLKPRNMAGVVRRHAALRANDGGEGDAGTVELLARARGRRRGRAARRGVARRTSAHGANKVAKKKIWEKVQPDLVRGDEAAWRGRAGLRPLGRCVRVAQGWGNLVSDDAKVFYGARRSVRIVERRATSLVVAKRVSSAGGAK